MRKLFAVVILIQLVVIGLLFWRISILSDNKVLGTTTSIAPLNKENLVFPTGSEFKYFYTFKPATTLSDLRPWDHAIVHYTYNKDGLNERYDYDVVKPRGVFRIITLGDSFTSGLYLDTKDNWTELLEDKLNQERLCPTVDKFEVINVGMQGYDVPYLVKRYADFGLKYNPDLILWFESGSGFTRDNERIRPLADECVKQEGMETYDESIFQDKLHECFRKIETEIVKYDELAQVDIANWLDKFFVIRGDTPTLFASFNYIDPEYKDSFFNRAVVHPNVYVMNEVTSQIYKDNTFPDWHPNQKGHISIANDIYKYLMKNKDKLLRCN